VSTSDQPSVPIDLRSDTVTRPSPAMRAAMAAADVGDDQYGEDPTVNRLQAQLAALLGKEAALWLPTGTMANQVALRILTAPGDDVVVARECHLVWHEAGAGAANSGVQFTEAGTGGLFDADAFLALRKPRGHMAHPPTTVVAIENTHNRGGGIVVPAEIAAGVCRAAAEHEVASFLDGARLWNAAVALGRAPGELAAPFDLVSVAFSKGLGAPAGSLLAGRRDAIARAVRHRRMLGGAMRQAGVLAAACLYGLDHHMADLATDHANARRIGARLAGHPRLDFDVATVQTNIVVFRLHPGAPDAATFVARARAAGVLVVPFGPRTIRAVTHRDVSAEACARAADVLADIADGPPA